MGQERGNETDLTGEVHQINLFDPRLAELKALGLIPMKSSTAFPLESAFEGSAAEMKGTLQERLDFGI